MSVQLNIISPLASTPFLLVNPPQTKFGAMETKNCPKLCHSFLTQAVFNKTIVIKISDILKNSLSCWDEKDQMKKRWFWQYDSIKMPVKLAVGTEKIGKKTLPRAPEFSPCCPDKMGNHPMERKFWEWRPVLQTYSLIREATGRLDSSSWQQTQELLNSQQKFLHFQSHHVIQNIPSDME